MDNYNLINELYACREHFERLIEWQIVYDEEIKAHCRFCSVEVDDKKILGAGRAAYSVHREFCEVFRLRDRIKEINKVLSEIEKDKEG